MIVTTGNKMGWSFDIVEFEHDEAFLSTCRGHVRCIEQVIKLAAFIIRPQYIQEIGNIKVLFLYGI